VTPQWVVAFVFFFLLLLAGGASVGDGGGRRLWLVFAQSRDDRAGAGYDGRDECRHQRVRACGHCIDLGLGGFHFPRHRIRKLLDAFDQPRPVEPTIAGERLPVPALEMLAA
jgi:hypothetical protein